MCSNSVLTKQLLDLWLKSRKSYPWNGSDPTLDSYISTVVNELNSCLSPTCKLGKSVPHNCYDLRIVLEKWNRTGVVKRAVEFHSAIHLPCDFGQVTLSHKKEEREPEGMLTYFSTLHLTVHKLPTKMTSIWYPPTGKLLEIRTIHPFTMSDHSHPEARGTIPTSIEVSFLELNIKRSRILPKGSLEP